MRTLKNLCFSFFLISTLAGSVAAQTADQVPQNSPNASPVVTVDQAIDRGIEFGEKEVGKNTHDEDRGESGSVW